MDHTVLTPLADLVKIVQNQQQEQKGKNICEPTQPLLIPKVEHIDPSEAGKLIKTPRKWKRQGMREKKKLRKRGATTEQEKRSTHGGYVLSIFRKFEF